MYSPEEFVQLKSEIVAERNSLETRLNDAKAELDSSLQATERTFTFCAFAAAHFKSGDLRKKREIFSTIGSNLTIWNGKLFIEKLHPYLLIENELKTHKAQSLALEHKFHGSKDERNSVFVSSTPSWLATSVS